MRKMMTKEVPFTTIKAIIVRVEQGEPVTEKLPDTVVLGTLSQEKAQKLMEETHKQVTVYRVKSETKVYEMAVEDFIQHAKIKEEQNNDE